MTAFLAVITFVILLLLVFLLPYDWWQKPPAKQPDRAIGKFLPFLTISLRIIVLRLLFVAFFIFVYLQTIIFIPLLAGVVVICALLGSVWQRIRGKSAEPVSGLIILLIMGCVFAIGVIAPLRTLPITGYLLLGRPAGNAWEALTVGSSWMTLDGIIGLCGIFGVASWMVVDSIWRLRQAHQVGNLATSRIGSLAMGLVEVQGNVRPAAGTGGEPPVELSYSMFDYLQPSQRISPFLLEDRTGSVLVDATTCRVRAGWISEVAAIFGTREIVLTKRVVRDDFTDAVTKRLAYGDQVYVIGNAERDASGRTIIRPAERPAWNKMLWSTLFGTVKPPKGKDIHDVFFLTDGSEREAKAHILKGFRTVLLWGMLWITASATIMVTAREPWRKAPPPDSWRSSHWRGPEPNPSPAIRDYTGRNKRLFRFERYIKTVTPASSDQVPALLEAMSHNDYRFYEPATSALLRLKDLPREQLTAAIPLIIGHLHSCRYNAMQLQMTILAIASFGPLAEPAVPGLIEQLSCEKTNTYEVTPDIIHYQAARALGAIGPAAKDAVPALQAAMNSRTPAVRDAARSALGKITGERPALTTEP
jgi:hypothetical protein